MSAATTTTTTTGSARGGAPPGRPRLDVRFPPRGQGDVAEQDEEWCEVVDEGGAATRVRLHDYAQMFAIPGLYDQLFGGPGSATECVSPQVMAGLLRDHLHLVVGGSGGQEQGQEQDREQDHPPARGAARLRVLDLGAGNGMVGEEVRAVGRAYGDGALARAGSTVVVGFDILPEARRAAERDRPGVYDRYVVADITEYVRSPPGGEDDGGEAGPPPLPDKYNVLVSISALAFSRGAADALRAAASLVEDGGLIAFNLREGFLDLGGSGEAGKGRTSVSERGRGFSQLVREAIAQGKLSILTEKTYRHRLSVTGEPLYYVGVVVQKHGDLG